MDLTNSNISISADVVSRSNRDGSIVVMKTDSSDVFFKITGEATKIWNSLKENSNLDSTMTEIAERNGQSIEQVRKDTLYFIQNLKDKTLIDFK